MIFILGDFAWPEILFSYFLTKKTKRFRSTHGTLARKFANFQIDDHITILF
jgi:hypothetical protein